MTQSIEKNFLVDLLTRNNAIYRDSLILNNGILVVLIKRNN